MLLLLLFLLTLGVGAIYWFAPGINTMRSGIAAYLQQQLALDHLQMGEISWYWAGAFHLHVEQLEFSRDDLGLAYRGGSVSIDIPMTRLFRGDFTPDRLQLQRGVLTVRLAQPPATSAVPLPELTLSAVDLRWHYHDWHGELPGIDFDYHAGERAHRPVITLHSPALTLTAQLDHDGLPAQAHLNCRHTRWLPDAIQQQFDGTATVELNLQRSSHAAWQIDLHAQSKQPFTVMPKSAFPFRWQQLQGRMTLQMDDQLQALTRLDLQQLQWHLGENSATVQGDWHDGRLQLQASAPQLSMPLVWSWLRPLGNDAWRRWLASMQGGVASDAHADLSLAWPDPLHGWPAASAWDQAHYHLKAKVQQADIALGLTADRLLHTAADVRLDAQGLDAEIHSASLPRAKGQLSGTLHIPWQTLMLQIRAHARAGVAPLLRWFGPADLADWQWHGAQLDGDVAIRWDPAKTAPEKLHVTMQPHGRWQLNLLGVDVTALRGRIIWDAGHGLTIRKLALESKQLQGDFSLHVQANGKQWRLQQFDARGHGQLAPLAAHFQLPLSHPRGELATTVHYDGSWSGTLDLTAAGWDHLLGSAKPIGEVFQLQYRGTLDAKQRHLQLQQLTSRGTALQIKGGSFALQPHGLQLALDELHTPAFAGSLQLNLPFAATKPWRIQMQASYLNRNALPAALQQQPDQLASGKPWQLQADIEQLEWNDARMSGVHAHLASDSDAIGVLEAAQVHTAHLNLMDVDARFTLPGQGRVDLHTLTANLEKQRLNMSATLEPVAKAAGGGMRWRGFVAIQGDFGHLMKRGQLSQRFLGGEMNLLFSGTGLLLRDQPWWQGLDGRLRMRVNKGRILQGGTLTTLLAAINLSKIPALLLGQRDDLTGEGMLYDRLQMEAIMQNQQIRIRNVVLRSTAFDLVAHGKVDVEQATIDLYLIANPFQNLDAMLAKIPLLRDILGGMSHSLMRKVYRLSGPFADAKVVEVTPKEAGLAAPGLIEALFTLPDRWFGGGKQKQLSSAPTPSAPPATAP